MGRRIPEIENIGADYGYSNDRTGATGKYYFRWDEHGDNIKKITGVKDKEEFLKSPEAQEEYFKWHTEHKLKSGIDRYKKSGYENYSDEDLAKIIHFKGETGGRKFIKKEIGNKPTSVEKPIPVQQEIIPNAAPKNPITVPEKELWEKMQAAAYQRHIYEDELAGPKGVALMKEFGIDPARVPDYYADIAKKSEDQRVPGAIPQVSQGFTSKDLYSDVTPRQRYVHFASQRGNNPTESYGTDLQKYLDDQAKEKSAVQKGWAGFGDPTQDVNYRAPGIVSGFGGSPGLSADTPPAIPDPRFPTRDPITGRVTPPVIVMQ